jgi:ATP-dependent protease HslVU (ClpYQ) peptidase subunit
MTTLIALVDEATGTAYLACDHQGTSGWVRTRIRTKKYIRLRDVIIGVTGSYRMLQVLEHGLSIPVRDPDTSAYDHLWHYVVEPARKLLKDYESSESDEGKASTPGEMFLLYDGSAYSICTDYSLHYVDDFNATGSGREFALGSLDSTDGLPIEQRIEKAMKAAGRYDISTSETYDVVESKRSS